MKKHTTDSSMYTGTPCDKCGGPTLAIGQGSIWCPDEDAHKGGHWVRRVAFAQPPAKGSDRGTWSKQPAARTPRPVERRASVPTTPAVKVEGFDTGMDGFVKSDRS